MRRKRVTFLTTTAEYNVLAEEAVKMGMSIGAYIRWKLFHNNKEE